MIHEEQLVSLRMFCVLVTRTRSEFNTSTHRLPDEHAASLKSAPCVVVTVTVAVVVAVAVSVVVDNFRTHR